MTLKTEKIERLTDCSLDGMTVNGYDISELIEFYKNNHKENG